MKTKMTLMTATALAALAAAPAFAQDARHAAHAADLADAPSAKSEQPATDTWITTKVKAELLTTEGVTSTDIGVETKNGTVWLSGDVKTSDERDHAIAKAKTVKGVKAVNATKLTVAGR